MLVSDLKKEIKKYSSDEKDKIIIELYKRIPKSKKEDYDIDSYILNINNKVIKKQEDNLSIDELEGQINFFVDCAYKELYYVPNKIIPKSERSKWRFKVKKWVKDLIKIDPTTDEGIRATNLLRLIFRMLSHSTNYLLFSNFETFRAIQIPQYEFLNMIIMRKLVNGYNKENLEYCINLLDVESDPTELRMSLSYTFLGSLNTKESRILSIDILKTKVLKLKDDLALLKHDKKATYSKEYYLKEDINFFTKTIVNIYLDLQEFDHAVSYFQKNYIERSIEIKEYVLLGMLENRDLIDEWIIEYEKHLGKIDYRDSLKENYNKFKAIKNDEA